VTLNLQNKNQPIVYVVDDDAGTRRAVALALEQEGLMVAAFGSAEAFFAAKLAERKGCAIVDLYLPGMNGIQIQEILAAQAIPLPVIILTGHTDIPTCVEAMKAGVDDFLMKPVTREKLLASVRAALAKGDRMRAIAEQSHLAKLRLMQLTDREYEIMKMLVNSASNKEIARCLKISYRTVEKHRKRILDKTGSSNLLELLDLARKNGLTSAQEPN
jgi:FixJ family two-component response regulator